MMRVKKYVARSLAEAIVQAKSELGREAFIVDSRKLKVGGLFGLFGRSMTEVTVAVDDKVGAGAQPAGAAQAAAPTGNGSAVAPAPAQAATQAQPAAQAQPVAQAQPAAQAQPMALTTLEREVAGLRAAVARLMDQTAPRPEGDLSGYPREVVDNLTAIGVEAAVARQIGTSLQDSGEEGQEALRQELDRLIGPGVPIEVHPGQRRVVALIGPTGVGKTTTLAKLAARFTLEQRLKVALVTSDTFRIAAIDQLRTYAEILGIPLYTVDTPAQVAEAMRVTADCDLVLVDTGGRNHRDQQRMQELRELLAVLRPDETHLVLSLTTNPRDAMEALDYYLPMGVNRLTFTKLDEATSPGLMVNLRLRCGHPVSYLTHGQSVPEDIMCADQADFAKIFLGA